MTAKGITSSASTEGNHVGAYLIYGLSVCRCITYACLKRCTTTYTRLVLTSDMYIGFFFPRDRYHRCVCDPLWSHAGYDCAGMRWGSWALLVLLVFVSVFSVTILTSAASRLSDSSSKHCQGLVELAKILYRRPQESGILITI